jgi:L,D-peptidoglycan transpeptidase YkuD (ErfK/YbiS/YcfS/YnhG family)
MATRPASVQPGPPAKKQERLMSRLIQEIRVSRSVSLQKPSKGFAIIGNVRIPCVLGRSGIVVRKREGDGGTPRGVFELTGGYFRGDRLRRPRSRIPLARTKVDDGWCDDPASFRYNRATRLPAPFRCERMMLEDNVYDVVLVTNYNLHPRRIGLGSAIFVHLQRPDLRPTEGCVAFAPQDLMRFLPRLSKKVRIVIG